MSRPLTPASSIQARFPAAAASALEPVSTSAEVMRQRSSSTSSRDTRARDLLDSSVGEKSLATDPKTRKDWAKFTQLVDRTLQSFDSVSEWADFITFLGKLLKCLQTYPNFAYIPHKLVVAKRLAQCLNPALPTGVHQRALDVYVHILNAIGLENLKRDLQLWSSGLFPFFQYAATSVRPIVLGIYSKFYIPLQDALRPATKAMILALLPGLEEETGEFFEKVAGILDQLSGTVSPSFFLQNIWLTLITAPSLRIAALNYLARRMPKIGTEDSIALIVGEDVGLMVRAFAAALEDGQILVQRAALDLVALTLRLDGAGFQKDTRRQEQLILMRAMIGVVLRRDLSLSRRLYGWLLGQAEDSDSQIKYFRQNGLVLLRQALVLEIIDPDPSADETASRQRPFKVLLSLLDKWEISYPLTEVIVSDLVRALDKFSRDGQLGDELLTTASMLFDGLDPFLTWRHLYLATKGHLSRQEGSQRDALDLLAFVIHAFRLSEDEVVKLHAPVTAFGLLDLVKASRSANLETSPEDYLLALNIIHALLKETSASFFTASERQDKEASVACCGMQIADEFYSATDNKAARIPTTGFASRLLSNGFNVLQELVLDLCLQYDADKGLRIAAINLLAFLADQPARDQPITMSWDPRAWLDRLVNAIAGTSLDFDTVDAVVQCLLAMQSAPLEPPLHFDSRGSIAAIIDKLMSFLDSTHSKYHVQAVSLIWAVQDISRFRHVEAAICHRLTTTDGRAKAEAFEAFGNLWRFTEDSQLPGVKLSMAMRIMLDALHSSDLTVRRAGEAWMRCSLKSYVRILDPLCSFLMDPSVQRKQRSLTFEDQTLEIEEYTQVFDLAKHQHALENLLSLASFGGQGFTRLAKSSYIKTSPFDQLRDRASTLKMENDHYLDLLCRILVRYLVSEPIASLASAMGPINTKIYAIAADILQVIISRGDLDGSMLQTIENALVSRLCLLVERSEFDLQNKLLHVLHSTITALAAQQKRAERKSTTSEKPSRLSIELPFGGAGAPLVKLLSRGICGQKNSAVIHHWIDFLLMTLQHFRGALQTLLFPLIDAITKRVQEFVHELEVAFDPVQKGKESSAGVNDADYTVLLNALERLIGMAAEEARASQPTLEETQGLERPGTASEASGAGGFLGYISTALGTGDSVQSDAADSSPKAKTAMRSRLDRFIQLLLSAWIVSNQLDVQCDFDEGTSQGYTSEHVKARTKKAFERLYKTNSVEVLMGIVELWHLDQQRIDSEDQLERQNLIFTMLDHLAVSAQSVVSMLADIINSQFSADKGRAVQSIPSNYEVQQFQFLEAYIDRQEGAVAVQIWSSFLTFAKEFINTPALHKYRLFPTLRCFTTLSEKISTTSALEDRRMRRDLLENFIKLVDATVQMSGRSGSGLQRPSSTSLNNSLLAKESETTAPLTPIEGQKEIPMDASIMSEKGGVNVAKTTDSAKELATFLAKRIVPDFRRFSIDNDKLAATCANIMYYNVSPAFKTRTKTFEVDDSVLDLLLELTKVPAALKSWRAQVLEVYNDNRFFYGTPTTAQRWKGIVQALITSDKERFPELIHRISTTTSSAANIFINRELESLSKSMSIRRLSYTIFCAEKNRYLTQLPAIQEKVVDLLRANVSDLVHSEVYLCLRVLLCRIGNQHLSSFWPIILTELLRLFETLMNDPTAQSTEYLQLILSACKFLDLLLVLQTEEFQIHQWMFVVDTVDAAYPPESWTPQATMDRLGEIVNQRGDLIASHHGPKASISLLDSKSFIMNHGNNNNMGGAVNTSNAIASSIPMSAMTSRNSFFTQSEQQDKDQDALTQAGHARSTSSTRALLAAAGLLQYEDDGDDNTLSSSQEQSTKHHHQQQPLFTTLRRPSIKPLLSRLRQSKITSLAALEPFFSRASLANYEAVYSLGNVDWPAVEKSLEADLFEGDE